MIEFRPVTDRSTKQAYEQIYSSEGILLTNSFYMWLVSLLPERKEANILDISCGEGRLGSFAMQRGIRAYGVDFSFEAVKKSKIFAQSSISLVGDGEKLPFADRSFDFITHIGSLEHYENPHAGAKEISRLLRPDGIAIVLLPNTFSLLGNVKHAAQKGDVFIDNQPLQRYNTLKGWRKILVECGLQPFKILKYEVERPRTWSDFAKLIRKPSRLIHLAMTWAIPLGLANCFVFLCKPSHDMKQ